MRESGRFSDPAWAWAVYQPDEQRPWNLARTGHLYRRAGFGANWSQLRSALATSPREAIERLIVAGQDVDGFNRTFDAYENLVVDSEDSLRAWWLRRMLETPHTLLEKLTLFWHSHFAVSNTKVENLKLVSKHVQTLRRHALGNYRDLLFAVMQDPATFLAMGAPQNRKATPNTGVARQLLEQYTLGPGLTSDKDIQEASRAFTGWFVRGNRLRFVAREHDNGRKVFLGRSGNWGSQDILDIVLEHSEVPRHIVRKLYHLFISESDTPPDSLVTSLADTFGKDFDIAKVVRRMLSSNLFFSNQAYRRRIKSPVEYALGIVLGMEARVPTLALGQDIKHLGQELYNPPTRDGWLGGRRWLSPPMLIARANLAADLLSNVGRYAGKLDPLRAVAGSGVEEARAQRKRLLEIVLQGDLDSSESKSFPPAWAGSPSAQTRDLRSLAKGVFMLPEFQLA